MQLYILLWIYICLTDLTCWRRVEVFLPTVSHGESKQAGWVALSVEQ